MDRALITEWWSRWPDANIAVALNGVVVIDIDGPEGEESLAALIRQHGPLPETLQSKTGRGRQLFFTSGGADIRNSTAKLGPGLDVRGEGGYVVLPPSVHPNGNLYGWVCKVRPAALPAWLREKLTAPAPQPPADGEPSREPIPQGQRNSTLTSLAGTMRRRGLSQKAIEAALLEENRARCQPPLAEGDVRQISASVGRYAPADAATGKLPDCFTLSPLAELLDRPIVATDWIWEAYLAAGTVSAVVSKPKVGKSTFARNLCLAVARGESFLGAKTRQGRCIYLALEERVEDVTADFRAMGATGEEPVLVHADSTPAAGIVALLDLVREKAPALVIIDPLFRLVRVKDEKAYAETYAALGPLIDISRNTGTHLLLTHHSGKSLKADVIDSPLGSTAIAGAVCSLVVLKRTEAYRTIQTVQRLGQDLPEIVIQFDPQSRTLSLGGTRFEADRSKAESAILEFLKDAKEPQNQAQIRGGVDGYETRIVRAALTSLDKAGKVAKSGEGTKGKPFTYEFWFAGSQHIVQTSKPECEKVAPTRINTERILVCDKSEKSILVREKKQAGFEPKNGPEIDDAEVL
jgi:hypothetical protein